MNYEIYISLLKSYNEQYVEIIQYHNPKDFSKIEITVPGYALLLNNRVYLNVEGRGFLVEDEGKKGRGLG